MDESLSSSSPSGSNATHTSTSITSITTGSSSHYSQEALMLLDAHEYGQGEYEQRRDELLKRILQTERLGLVGGGVGGAADDNNSSNRATTIRHRWHKMNRGKFDQFQEAVLNKRCPAFESRKQQVDSEFDGKRQTLEVSRALQLDSLARRQQADLHFLQANFRAEKERVKGRIGQEIEQKLRLLAEEEQRLEAHLSDYLNESSTAASEAHQIGRYQKQRAKTAASSSTISGAKHGNNAGANVAKKPSTSMAKPSSNVRAVPNGPAVPVENGVEEEHVFWQDMPVIIAQLPKSCIKQDLALFLSS